MGGSLVAAFFGLCLVAFLRVLWTRPMLAVTTTALELRLVWGGPRSYPRAAVVEATAGELPAGGMVWIWVSTPEGTTRQCGLPPHLDADPEELADWLTRWATAVRER